jgi:hypothetical protein
VIGGDILKRPTALLRPGGTLVTTIEPPTIQPENGRAILFVVEADRSQLVALAQRLREGRLTPNVGAVRPLGEAPAAFGPNAPHASGETIIQVIEGW